MDDPFYDHVAVLARRASLAEGRLTDCDRSRRNPIEGHGSGLDASVREAFPLREASEATASRERR